MKFIGSPNHPGVFHLARSQDPLLPESEKRVEPLCGCDAPVHRFLDHPGFKPVKVADVCAECFSLADLYRGAALLA